MSQPLDPKKPASPGGATPCEDEIDESLEESFPASDPPAHSRPDVVEPEAPDLDPNLPD
jgi:hypothetical protein